MQEKTPFGWIFRIFNEQKPLKDINMKKALAIVICSKFGLRLTSLFSVGM